MKERITITIDKDLLDWLDSKVSDRTFANRSHGFEYVIQRRIDEDRSLSPQEKQDHTHLHSEKDASSRQAKKK